MVKLSCPWSYPASDSSLSESGSSLNELSCIRAGFDELSAGLESKVGAYRQEFAVHHKVVRSLFSKFAAMKPESMSDEVANAAEWKVTHTFTHTGADAAFRCWRMPLQIPN